MANTTTQNIIQINNGQFFLNPKEIFCGDKVFLQYQSVVTDDIVFSLSNVLPLEINDSESLYKLINVDPLICSLENFKIFLDGNVLTYQINCVGWQLGKVIIPSMRVKLESMTLELPGNDFTVVSILEKTGESSLQPTLAPILLPGTTYTVYGIIFLGILIISFFIFLLTKSSKICYFFKSIILSHKYKKNYKKCLGLLKKLSKNSDNLSEIKFAEELQTIMRIYFSFRFSDKVYNLATSEIIGWFSTIYKLILPEQADQAIQMFYELMLRCDFLRFSGNSVKDSGIQENEKEQLIQKAISIMNLIEKGSSNA